MSAGRTVVSLLAACFLAATTWALPTAAASPTPGAPYYASRSAVQSFLQRRVDFASCRGIQRFGAIGYPRQYVVWDCRTELDGRVCRGVRVRAVHTAVPGRFRLVTLRRGVCAAR